MPLSMKDSPKAMTTASASALARSINIAVQPMVAATPKQTFAFLRLHVIKVYILRPPTGRQCGISGVCVFTPEGGFGARLRHALGHLLFELVEGNGRARVVDRRVKGNVSESPSEDRRGAPNPCARRE